MAIWTMQMTSTIQDLKRKINSSKKQKITDLSSAAEDLICFIQCIQVCIFGK